MDITVNGQPRQVGCGTTITGLLEELEIEAQPPGVAVAVDGEIAFRHTWEVRVLQPGDAVEIVRAVAGG